MTRLPLILAALYVALAGPGPAAADTLEILARATKSTFDLQVRPAADHHLAEDYPAKLVLRTLPETAVDDVIDLSGRIPELLSGLSIDLPEARPLVIDGELEVGVCDATGTCTPREVGFQFSIRRKKPVPLASLELRPVRHVKTREDIAESAGEGGLRKVVRAASLDGGLRAALNEAEGRADPLLIVFATRWCPPCRRLKTEVLDDPDHAALLERFVVARFDADQPNSWEAKSRWRVGGYPTVLVCAFDGEVVWRQVGFDDPAAFAAQLAAVYDELEQALEDPTPEEATPEQALRMADRARHGEDRAAAATWLATLPADAAVDARTLAEVRAFLARTDPEPAAGAAALEALLLAQALDPVVPLERQMWWWYRAARLREAAADPAGATLDWQRGRATAEQFLAGGVGGLAAGDAWTLVATAEQALDAADAATAAWSNAADAFLAALSLGEPIDPAVILENPGPVLMACEALLEAGRGEEQVRIVDAAVDAFPDEPTFFRVRARSAAGLSGDPAQGLADAATAYRLASGDERLRAADLWSELLVELGRSEEASGLLHEVLDDLRLPDDAEIRTHRYAGILRERLSTLEPAVDGETP